MNRTEQSPGATLNIDEKLEIARQAITANHLSANQVTSDVGSSNGIVVKTFGYSYDPAENRLTERVDGTTNFANYNVLGEVTSVLGSTATAATYEWDGAQRLTAVNRGNQRTWRAHIERLSGKDALTRRNKPPRFRVDRSVVHGPKQFTRVVFQGAQEDVEPAVLSGERRVKKVFAIRKQRRKAVRDFLQKAVVDFVDDFQMSGQQRFK